MYGQLGLNASKEERVFLARLYWFTVEFGLLQPKDGPLCIYGGGILSSLVKLYMQWKVTCQNVSPLIY